MRAGASFAAWLAHDDQDGRSDRPAASGCACPTLSNFAGLLDRLEASGASAPELRLDTLAALHALLADSGWLHAALAQAIAAARAEPFFEPPFASLGTGLHQGLVLLDHPLATVSLAAIPIQAAAVRRGEGGSRSIGFPGVASLARVLAGGGAEIALWEADEPGPDFTSAAAGPCRSTGTRRLGDGELLAIDGRTQSFAVERLEGDLVLLRGEVRVGAAPLAREYDPETLALVGVSTTDEVASRMALMMSLVRAFGRAEAAPLFADIAASGPFFLRWSTMRELLALDPVAAVPVLRAMARSDPHPEVRAAAAATERDLSVRYPLLFAAERRAA